MDVMDYTLSEWINLLLRWAHVFAAILWIGTTYFFTWLDGAFSRRDDVWLVHSGGFYIVKKEKLVAGVAGKLHWFRWEAAWTWITGVLLLVFVYDHGGLLVDAGSNVRPAIAAMAGFAVLADKVEHQELVHLEQRGMPQRLPGLSTDPGRSGIEPG